MRTEYVIVHGGMIERSAQFFFPDSILALKRIRELDKLSPKRLKEEPANTIHPDLPPPAEDLEVVVCGAYRDICVQTQIDSLTKAGYNTRIYREATIESRRDPMVFLYDSLVASYRLLREHYSNLSKNQ